MQDATGATGVVLGGLEKTMSKFGLTGFSEVFAEGRSAATEMAQKVTNFGKTGAGFIGKIKVAFAGISTVVTGIVIKLAGPMGFLLALGKIYNVLIGVSKQTTELGKSMSLSAEQALEFRKELSVAAQASGEITANTRSLAEAQGQLAKAFGAARGFTMEQLSDQTKLTRAVGMQVESAGKLKSFEKPNLEQKYPRATAEYDIYVLRNLRATDDPQGKKIAAGNMGFVPFDQKTGRFDYNKMIAGGYYYDPRQRSFVTRKPGIEGKPDQFFLVDAYTFKETLIERD